MHQLVAASGDKFDGVQKIYLDGQEKTIYCENGWMKVYSVRTFNINDIICAVCHRAHGHRSLRPKPIACAAL